MALRSHAGITIVRLHWRFSFRCSIVCAVVYTIVATPGAVASAGAQVLRVASTSSVRMTADAIDTNTRAIRVLDVQQALVAELRQQWNAVPAPALPGWQRALRAAEHTAALAWQGPAPVVLMVPDFGRGFVCPGGRCNGRFEGTRVITVDSAHTDTVVVGVILLAASQLMSPDVWRHEFTHALLAQHDLIDASVRHDPKYFGKHQSALHE